MLINDIVAVVVFVVTVANLIYNLVGFVSNYHDVELKDHYLGFFKVFGYIGLMEVIVQLICRYIHFKTNMGWPIGIAVIIAIMSMVIIVLSMIIQYEDRKYAPLS